MTEIKHDLDHEVYIEADGKEHVNHGKMEYTKADLESAHAYYDEYHKNDEPAVSYTHLTLPTIYSV